MSRILVVDDEPAILRGVADNLKRELEREPYGYELVVMARIDGSCFE